VLEFWHCPPLSFLDKPEVDFAKSRAKYISRDIFCNSQHHFHPEFFLASVQDKEYNDAITKMFYWVPCKSILASDDHSTVQCPTFLSAGPQI